MVFSRGEGYDLAGGSGAAAANVFKAMVLTVNQELKLRSFLPKLALISAKSALAAAFAKAAAGYAETLTSLVQSGATTFGAVKQTGKLDDMAKLTAKKSDLQKTIDEGTSSLKNHENGLGGGLNAAFDPVIAKDELSKNESLMKDLDGKMNVYSKEFDHLQTYHAIGQGVGQLSSSLIKSTANFQEGLAGSVKESAEGTYRTMEGSVQSMSTTTDALLRAYEKNASWTARA